MARMIPRSEEHTSELQSLRHLVCRLLLEKKKKHRCALRSPPPDADGLQPYMARRVAFRRPPPPSSPAAPHPPAGRGRRCLLFFLMRRRPPRPTPFPPPPLFQ